MGKSQTAVLEFIHIRSGLARTGVSSLLSSWGYSKDTARRLRQPIWYSSGCSATLTIGIIHKSPGFIEDELLKKEKHSPSAAVWEPPKTIHDVGSRRRESRASVVGAHGT